MTILAHPCRCHTENLELDDEEHVHLVLAGGRVHIGDLDDMESCRSEIPVQLWHEVDELAELARGESHGDPGLLTR